MAQAVREAQTRGFAEADPRSDLSGQDAAFKLGIITRTAFGVEVAPEQIDCSGIEQLTPADVLAAQSANKNMRLVASCEHDGEKLRLSVQLCELEAGDYLAGACNEENRVEIHTAGGCVRLSGKGAGRWPTAVAVLGDVYAQLRASRNVLIR